MNREPLVSIIMPAYNAEKYVRSAIDSVLNQAYANWELLIADDASKDATRQIVESYKDSRIRFFHNETNLGYLKTWNKLMQLTAGELITFQDADDDSKPERVQLLVNAFLDDPALGLCGSNVIRIDQDGNTIDISDFPLAHEEIKAKLPGAFLFVGSALMIRRSMYEEFGGYNEYFDRVGAEDLYWAGRMMLTHKVINLEPALYLYRFNPQSVTRDVKFFRQRYIGYLVSELIRLQMETGTDPLASGDHRRLKRLEEFFEMRQLFWMEQNGKAVSKALGLLLKNPFRERRFYRELRMQTGKLLKKKLRGKS